MQNKKVPQQFIVRIALKNDAGVVVGEREFITYAGLLAVAHEIGLDTIETSIEEMPSEANGQTAVVRAVVKGKPGTFTGLGDASPANVGRRVARHLLRVAETRAKARALRDLCNVHMLALEELEGDDAEVGAPHAPRPSTAERQEPPRISDGQKRMLWRQAAQLGHEGDAAMAFLAQRLGGPPERATRDAASKLIDALAAEQRARSTNGASHGAG
jgi:hypothetical protein